MSKWTAIPSDEIIAAVAENLSKNGFATSIVETKEDAKKKVLEMVPEGSEVLVNTSITLEQSGILDAIDNSGKYTSVRKKIFSLDYQKDADEIRKLRSTQEFALGSAHAVTKNGQIVIASNSGSQLPGEVFGAKHVIFVISANKIVENIGEAEQRINEYIVPLESVRARKQYNLPETWNTFPSKLLIYNKEPAQDRVHVVLAKEVLGF